MPAIQRDEGEAFPTISFTGAFAFEDVRDIERTLAMREDDHVLVLDLQQAWSIDAAVLGTFVRWQKVRGGRLVTVVRESQLIARLMKLTKVSSFLNVVGSRSEALERAAVLRDVSSVTYSRDGVRHPS